MSAVCFEPVCEENLAQAGEVHAASWQASHRAICSETFVRQHTPERQMEYLRGELDAGKQVWLLKDDQTPVGVVSVNGNLIENLYVHPAYWRRGYGAALLEYAQTQCCAAPVLWILSSNDAARKLYEKHGFAQTGKTKRLNDMLYEIEMQKKSR